MLPPKTVLKDRISRIIAATRFPFINQTNWNEERRTLVNTQKEKPYGVKISKNILYPSIVVLNPNGIVREIGEVELDVNEKLLQKWRLLSEVTSMGERFKKLFIYVPKGKGYKAQKLLEQSGIEYAGLREWCIEDGILRISPIKTPDMDYDHRVS
jgi:hypothetical protein